MKQQGVDWSTKTLADSSSTSGIKGKWVEISGWLLFDIMHVGEAENTNPGNPKNWRATCWEIHPISSIRIVSDSPGQPPPSSQVLHPELLKAFHKTRVRETGKGHNKEKLIERNTGLLANFDRSEVEADDSPEKVEGN